MRSAPYSRSFAEVGSIDFQGNCVTISLVSEKEDWNNSPARRSHSHGSAGYFVHFVGIVKVCIPKPISLFKFRPQVCLK
jgi:hypothetical protein